jgi:hypothetical protein
VQSPAARMWEYCPAQDAGAALGQACAVAAPKAAAARLVCGMPPPCSMKCCSADSMSCPSHIQRVTSFFPIQPATSGRPENSTRGSHTCRRAQAAQLSPRACCQAATPGLACRHARVLVVVWRRIKRQAALGHDGSSPMLAGTKPHGRPGRHHAGSRAGRGRLWAV